MCCHLSSRLKPTANREPWAWNMDAELTRTHTEHERERDICGDGFAVRLAIWVNRSFLSLGSEFVTRRSKLSEMMLPSVLWGRERKRKREREKRERERERERAKERERELNRWKLLTLSPSIVWGHNKAQMLVSTPTDGRRQWMNPAADRKFVKWGWKTMPEIWQINFGDSCLLKQNGCF